MRKTFQGYVEVGRRPAFRRFWLGMTISRAGDAFTTVTLAWVVLDIAGPVQLGVVLMCFGLPRIVSGPVAGRLLERFRPRILLAADNAGSPRRRWSRDWWTMVSSMPPTRCSRRTGSWPTSSVPPWPG